MILTVDASFLAASMSEQTLPITHYKLALQDQDDNEDMKIWKELVVINMEVLSLHLPT